MLYFNSNFKEKRGCLVLKLKWIIYNEAVHLYSENVNNKNNERLESSFKRDMMVLSHTWAVEEPFRVQFGSDMEDAIFPFAPRPVASISGSSLASDERILNLHNIFILLLWH